jgi:hypothetical protein
MLMTRGTSVQGQCIPQQHIVRQIGKCSSPAEDMQRWALVFPIRAGPSGSCTSAGNKALAIRPQQNSRLDINNSWQGMSSTALES